SRARFPDRLSRGRGISQSATEIACVTLAERRSRTRAEALLSCYQTANQCGCTQSEQRLPSPRGARMARAVSWRSRAMMLKTARLTLHNSAGAEPTAFVPID